MNLRYFALEMTHSKNTRVTGGTPTFEEDNVDGFARLTLASTAKGMTDLSIWEDRPRCDE